MTLPFQPGILESVPAHARYLTFRLKSTATAEDVLKCLGEIEVDPSCVVGLGLPVLGLLGGSIDGLRPFPSRVGKGVEMPATGGALWLWLRGDDAGDLLHLGRCLRGHLAREFELLSVTDGFRFHGGLDLSGYVDGTENPEGEAALLAGFVADRGAGLDGGSFVAVQRWVHDLGGFDELSAAQQDDIIGRRKSDNVEFDSAPASAHVKRTAQESFDPEAFVLRRSSRGSTRAPRALSSWPLGPAWIPSKP
jgi:putative iron-dependent peroxidase